MRASSGTYGRNFVLGAVGLFERRAVLTVAGTAIIKSILKNRRLERNNTPL